MSKTDSEEAFYGSVASSEEESDQLRADEYPYEVVSIEEIVQYMENEIREVNSVMEFTDTTARILLSHLKWDRDILLIRFYDEDREKLFAEARVVNPYKKKTEESNSSSHSKNETEECGVCFMTVPTDAMSGLECGHRFCTACWRAYFETKIQNEGENGNIACAAYDCDILVDDATVMRLVEDPKVKSKYQHLITNSFVECNRLLRWCQTAGCNRAIKVQYVESKPVTCKCNNTFCFLCGEDWHGPVTCDLLRRWKKKCSKDVISLKWMMANTKDCPKCYIPIEKNGGCNLMTCRNCKSSFCWTCLQLIDEHDPCNSHSEVTTPINLKTNQERYEFYINRYTNQKNLLNFEKKLYRSIEIKMDQMQKHNKSWMEVQVLKKAVDVLCSCRRTLMYTYIFAFFLKKNNQSAIFNDNQKDLEKATEALSEYLERDITDKHVKDVKTKLQDKYKYCEIRNKVLFEHVQEGFHNNWWAFI